MDRSYIQAQPQTKTPLALDDYEPQTKAFGKMKETFADILTKCLANHLSMCQKRYDTVICAMH